MEAQSMILLLTAQTEGLSRLFDLDFQLVADASLMIVAMLFLSMFASHFLFNPVRDLLRNRQDKIASDLSTAEQDKEEAAKMREKYEALLAQAQKEAEGILADARKRGLDNEGKIVAEAKEEAAKIIERARQEAELEKQKVSDEVKREMVAVASVMAAKVIQANIDTNVQHQLIEETLKEIGESTWLS